MVQFLEGCFSWPSLPATLLLLLVCGYWLLVIVGTLGMDSLDIDLDFDVDASVLQLGFVPLRWLNLGSVPTMLWVSVFAFVAWLASRLINSPVPHEVFDWVSDGRAMIRDFGIAIFLTKCITQPLRGKFDIVEPNTATDLIGKACVVSTSEVNDTFGEALYSTEAAPLRLTVRTTDGSLSKGDEATIVSFDAERNVYIIERKIS